MKKLYDWWCDLDIRLWWFNNWTIVVVSAGLFACLIGILLLDIHERMVKEQKRQEFMTYCISCGNSEEECKWEWERIMAGQAKGKNTILPITRFR